MTTFCPPITGGEIFRFGLARKTPRIPPCPEGVVDRERVSDVDKVIAPYFNAGYIEETVTAWNRPYYIGLSIDRTHMPGRHWLGFESADYQLERLGEKTRSTRCTTVFSYLHPSWYWRSFEHLGVESEHAYILRDLVVRAKH